LPITVLKSKLQSSNLFWIAKVTNENHRQIAAESRQKLCIFNSINSEIIGRKFTKRVHDVAGLLPYNLLKADSRLANPLLNTTAKSKGLSWQCLRTSPEFNWLL